MSKSHEEKINIELIEELNKEDINMGRVEELLSKKALPNTLSKNGVTALHEACNRQSVSTVKKLILAKANINMPSKKFKNTPLFFDAYYKNFEITKLLLEARADPNITRERGQKQPLHVAASRGNTEKCKLLVLHGALCYVKHPGPNLSASDYARASGHFDCQRAIMQTCFDFRFLIERNLFTTFKTQYPPLGDKDGIGGIISDYICHKMYGFVLSSETAKSHCPAVEEARNKISSSPPLTLLNSASLACNNQAVHIDENKDQERNGNQQQSQIQQPHSNSNHNVSEQQDNSEGSRRMREARLKRFGNPTGKGK